MALKANDRKRVPKDKINERKNISGYLNDFNTSQFLFHRILKSSLKKSILYFAVTGLSIKMTTMFPTVIQSPICMIVTDKMITIIHNCCSKSQILFFWSRLVPIQTGFNMDRSRIIAHPSRQMQQYEVFENQIVSGS